jgi:hypothetical protein
MDNNPKPRRFIWIGFYFASFILLLILRFGGSSHGNICGPGLDLMLYMILLLISGLATFYALLKVSGVFMVLVHLSSLVLLLLSGKVL